MGLAIVRPLSLGRGPGRGATDAPDITSPAEFETEIALTAQKGEQK